MADTGTSTTNYDPVVHSAEGSQSQVQVIANPEFQENTSESENYNFDFDSINDIIDVDFEDSYEAYFSDTTFDDGASTES